jgi:hypothetical protein
LPQPELRPLSYVMAPHNLTRQISCTLSPRCIAQQSAVSSARTNDVMALNLEPNCVRIHFINSATHKPICCSSNSDRIRTHSGSRIPDDVLHTGRPLAGIVTMRQVVSGFLRQMTDLSRSIVIGYKPTIGIRPLHALPQSCARASRPTSRQLPFRKFQLSTKAANIGDATQNRSASMRMSV